MKDKTRKEIDALAALAGEFQLVIERANELADEMNACAVRMQAQSLVDAKISELDKLFCRGEFAQDETISAACNRLLMLKRQAE